MASAPFNSGSKWLRWEPHIHTPGTVLNDQFGASNPWEEYLTKIEDATPEIKALGVTDYYLTDCYKQVVEKKKKGWLPNCDLIFPNIEMRLDIGTSAGSWTNIHLLVCPDDEDHLDQIRFFLNKIQFEASGQTFFCDREGLIRLGKLSENTDDSAALKRGVEQFKVNFDTLKNAYEGSDWAKRNILIAVSGGADGTSGVNKSADQTLRQKIEDFAHIIFSSNPNDRAFWLGESKKASKAELEERVGGLKPCLHGCDAHSQADVAAPDQNRYCWIKGAASFDGLRYACIAPHRALVDKVPPTNTTTPSQTIKSIEVSNAQWFKTPDLEFNSGLVTIIGARGSGKTALADIVAASCDAIRPDKRSFLKRAGEKLGDASVELTWANDEKAKCQLKPADTDNNGNEPKATYLSQQFVEELCAADGLAEDLVKEIERVIFDEYPFQDKGISSNFSQLKNSKLASVKNTRRNNENAIGVVSEQINDAYKSKGRIVELNDAIKQQQTIIQRYTADRTKLAPVGSDSHAERISQLATAKEIVRNNIRYFVSQKEALENLKTEVTHMQQNQFPQILSDLQSRYSVTGFDNNNWDEFKVDFIGNIDALIESKLTDVINSISKWNGNYQPVEGADDNISLIDDQADLNNQILSLLEAEIARLSRLASTDQATTNRFTAINAQIDRERIKLQSLETDLKNCNQAGEKIENLRAHRNQLLKPIIEGILAEEDQLKQLYHPLAEKLNDTDGLLQKLSFSVVRNVDLKEWARQGEELLDLRKNGKFRGTGTLLNEIELHLHEAWETGDAVAIMAALDTFRSCNTKELLKHSKYDQDDANYHDWAKRLAKWLFDTSYVSLNYSIEYDGTDIQKLSPGNRGIVLLMFYLALDGNDDSPLIIDQPEENLDPKSIHNELVPLFEQAKKRRQIFMVTHNANLVVNTDADQVVVATAGDRKESGLPPISYESGGLEDTHIRKKVCEVLEGGEAAFRERAKRLQIALPPKNS